MTTNQTDIPEPTSPTFVVVGNLNGQTVVAVRAGHAEIPWLLLGGWVWRSWGTLRDQLADIRVVDVPEVAAEIGQLKDRVVDLEAAAIYAEGVHQGEMASQRARFEARIAELEAAKPEPEWAGDQVVMVRFRKYSGNGWTAAYRADEGKWTLHGHGPGLSTDDLADLYEVRRLSPAAHAELLAIVRGEQA